MLIEDLWLGWVIGEQQSTYIFHDRRNYRYAQITFNPDAPMKKPSGLCEWYKPPWPTDIVGVRIVSPPTLNWPPERYRILAASFTIFERMKILGMNDELNKWSYLVESWEYVVRELNFSDCCVPHGCKTNTETCDTLLG
jgi:hypothetical protein